MARSLNVLGLLAFYFSAVLSHPTHSSFAPSRRAVDLEAFRISDTNTTYVRVVDLPDEIAAVNPLVKKDTYVETATSLVRSIAPGAEFRLVEDHYVGANGVSHVYFKQTVHGLDVDNADFTVNIAADGSIFSYANGFFSGTIPTESPLTKRDEISEPTAALASATTTLDLPVTGEAAAEPVPAALPETYTLTGTSGAVSDPEARLVYFVQADQTLTLTWRVETDVYDDWLLTYVDASADPESSLVHGVINYRADQQAPAPATYLVYPWGVNDPSEAGAARESIVSPWDAESSEFGFNNDGTTAYTSPRGNNGVAQTNPTGSTSTTAWQTAYRPSSSTLNFSYDYSPAMTDPTSYRDAAITQMFYTANVYHDVLYALGFTEAAGNFETNNNGQGGLGADMVVLNAQDGSGTNNANFATPPDGTRPRMRMYLWTLSEPQRDCAFEAGVVIHEYTHGLSNRLTGGPANSQCLSALESGGMGEGWSDFFATAIRLKAGDTRATDYAMGAWVSNDVTGIRAYLYSTDMATNPLTYASVNGMTAVHQIGTVWASILYEVMWNLIDKSGLSVAQMPVFDGQVPTDGKFLAMKIVTDGLALQPCNPNFIDARDAILDADVALTGGANACELWTGFAKRGLGAGAVYSSTARTESFEILAGVC